MNNTKKIIIISFEFPPQGGGIGSFAFQMAKNWHQMKMDVTALTITNQLSQYETAEFDKQQKFKIIRFNKYKFYFVNIIYRIYYSLKLIFSNRYDIVYCAQFSTGIIGLISRILFRIPYVMIGHGSEAFEKNKIRFIFLKIFYRFSNLVLVNSTYTLHQFQAHRIVNKNLHLIPLGGDDTLFDPKRINNNKLRDILDIGNKFVILTVGTLSERKNHSAVISALKILNDEYHNLHYVIVGTGPLAQKLKNIIKNLDLEMHVTLVGYVPDYELPYYYDLADLFILNSIIDGKGDVEGFGIVLIEANLMSKPVIGTKGSGMEDAIVEGKSGFIIEANNPVETAAAIKKFYSDQSLCRQMGEFGRERALKNFTWYNTAQKVLEKLFDIVE